MLKKALFDALRWSTKWYLGSFSTAIATFFFFEKYLNFQRFRSIRYGISIFILSFFIKALIQYLNEIENLNLRLQEQQVKLEILDTKKERRRLLTSSNYYGEAILILKDIFSKFHNLRKTNRPERKEMVKLLIFLCNQLKELFEKRLNQNYSVCIKVLGPDVDIENITTYAEVRTLCRDEISYRSRSQPLTIKHNIFENTCYTEIFHNIDNVNKSYYLNNDIPEDKYYKNTSFQIYGEIKEEYKDNIELRRKNWSLPYKSELVVPIVPLDSSKIDLKKQFLGYLCVDCSEEDAFHNKYDIGMLKGVADGIYDVIQLCRKKNNSND